MSCQLNWPTCKPILFGPAQLLLSPLELGATSRQIRSCLRARAHRRGCSVWVCQVPVWPTVSCGSAAVASFDAQTPFVHTLVSAKGTYKNTRQGAPAMWIMSCTRVTLSCPSVRRYLECSRHGRPPLRGQEPQRDGVWTDWGYISIQKAASSRRRNTIASPLVSQLFVALLSLARARLSRRVL